MREVGLCPRGPDSFRNRAIGDSDDAGPPAPQFSEESNRYNDVSRGLSPSGLHRAAVSEGSPTDSALRCGVSPTLGTRPTLARLSGDGSLFRSPCPRIRPKYWLSRGPLAATGSRGERVSGVQRWDTAEWRWFPSSILAGGFRPDRAPGFCGGSRPPHPAVQRARGPRPRAQRTGSNSRALRSRPPASRGWCRPDRRF